MGLPERVPEPDGLEIQRKPQPPAASERPDWLVGADEGAASEYARSDGSRPPLELVRPALVPADGTPPPVLSRPDAGALPGLPLASRAGAPPAPPRPVAWTAAGSSVPKLVQKPQPLATPEETPVEDLFESEPPASRTMLGAEDEAAAHGAPPPLHEPWWMVAGERLATDRKLQLVILSAILVVGGAWTFWPRPNAGVSVREIRRNAEQWEGRAVHVTGRVGEVFSIGQGVVFHLVQGRDTIVVFSRARSPEPRQKVSVDGTVSTGYLDGAPRVAILESAAP